MMKKLTIRPLGNPLALKPTYIKPNSRPAFRGSDIQWEDLGLIQTRKDSPVSDEFMCKLHEGIDSFPKMIPDSLQANGWKIKIAKWLTDAAPFLKGVHPRGGDSWTTADNRTGVSIKPNIFMAEQRWEDRPKGVSKFATSKLFPATVPVEPQVITEAGRLAKNIAPDRTARHEIGHAVDALLQYPSRSEAFRQAYIKDFNRLSDKEKQSLCYFIQADEQGKPSFAGKSEAFAEAVANLYGGGCNQNDDFREHFPNLLTYVKSTIQKWEDRKGRLPSAWDNGPPAKS